MKITLRAPIILRFSSPWTRESAFLLVAGLRASIISCFVFVGFVYPLSYLQWLRGPLVLVARVFSIPIYVLGKLVPPLASPVLDGHAEFADVWELFRAHMVAGVLAYLLVFHIPVLLRVIRRRPPGGAGVNSRGDS